MKNVKINGVLVNEVYSNITIFQLCFIKGIMLPCFCYHEKLSIAGNCRMCIVQINQSLGVSCAINVMDDMDIFTDNKRVRDSRESILEFILSNHPLDCPICDQGGECDLQDITMNFGSDRSRFYEIKKRAVTNLNLGLPLIKTVMTRCIHCTRCVRFANEIGDFDLGLLGRGLEMEIGNYVESSAADELSGNIVDLCPVGALTSMPYAFKARPWELNCYSNVDFFDAVASSLRVYVYGNEIKRVLPLLDENVNEEWLTNKARFAYDTLNTNRFYYSKVRINNKLLLFSWNKILPFLLKVLYWNVLKNWKVVVGSFLDLKSSLILKKFFSSFGCSNIYYTFNNVNQNFNFDFRYLFLLNNMICDLEKIYFILFVSSNLRLEAPLLNSRIKKHYLYNSNNMYLFSIGLSLKYLTYKVKNIGNNIKIFFKFLQGKSRFFCDLFFKNFNNFSFLSQTFLLFIKPLILLGCSLIVRFDFKSFINCLFQKIYSKFKIGLISNTIGFLSYCDLALNKINKKEGLASCYYLFNEDNIYNYEILNPFYIYQGFLMPKSLLFSLAHILLTSKAPFEFNGLFLNLEGRYRYMKAVVKQGFEDFEIFNALISYNNTKEIFKMSIINNLIYYIKMFLNKVNLECYFFFNLITFYTDLFYYNAYSVFNIINNVYEVFFSLNKKCKFINLHFFRLINNYYVSDYILRNSKIMSLCAIKTIVLNW